MAVRCVVRVRCRGPSRHSPDHNICPAVASTPARARYSSSLVPANMFWGGDESSDQLVVKPITIDVGGTKFHTSRQTICAKSPYFKALVDRGDKITGREIESVFVDRNPKHFMTLLDYMRTGKLLLEGDKASDVVLEELWLESEFYKLSKLSAVLTRLKELREQTRKNKAIDPTFPFFGYTTTDDERKAYVRLYYKDPSSETLKIEPFPLPVVSGSMDMGAFTKAYTQSFEAALNALIALDFSVEKLHWDEEGGSHRSYAILSIRYP